MVSEIGIYIIITIAAILWFSFLLIKDFVKDQGKTPTPWIDDSHKRITNNLLKIRRKNEKSN